MPRRKGHRQNKGGTNNKEQAKKRDRLAAKAARTSRARATFEAAREQPLEEPLEEQEELHSPTEIVHRDSAQQARKREMIVYHSKHTLFYVYYDVSKAPGGVAYLLLSVTRRRATRPKTGGTHGTVPFTYNRETMSVNSAGKRDSAAHGLFPLF